MLAEQAVVQYLKDPSMYVPIKRDDIHKCCIVILDKHIYLITTYNAVPKLRYRNLYCGNCRKNSKSCSDLDLECKKVFLVILYTVF